MSCGGPRQNEWRLHPDIVRLIWQRFGTALVDLFASRDNTHCRWWFSLNPRDLGCVGTHTLAAGSLVCVSPAPSDPSSSGTGRTGEIVTHYRGSGAPLSSVVSRASDALTDGSVTGAVHIGCAFTGPRDSAPPARCIGTAVGLAPERLILQGKGLPEAVINTI